METLKRHAVICAENFSFTYPPNAAHPSGERGIGPLSWRVEQGAFQLLVGSTGSGKTTLLRNLKPTLAPAGTRKGHLNVLGFCVGHKTKKDDSTLVGYVAQNPKEYMACDTVWHELAFGLENRSVQQDEMRRRVAEVAHFFGIEPYFDRPIADLSDGQAHLVALASVLVLRPSLLVLDEPTSCLDPVAEKSFFHALFRVNRELGLTVVLATHAPERCAAYASDVVELCDGCLHTRSLDAFATKPLRLAKTKKSPFPTPVQKKPVIEVRDVYQRYAPLDTWVLKGCDLAVHANSIHALIGGNGSGKSTLLRVVAGVVGVERGRVRNTLAQRQVLMPQDAKALFMCDSVEEELHEWQHGCSYTDKAIRQVLEYFCLEGWTQCHPYDLSGGQQQLLAFAKLILTNPDLLLLDEPTENLDARSKQLLAKAIDACVKGGATVLMATHDLAFAALVSDTTTMLFDGAAACSEDTVSAFEGNLFFVPMQDGFSRLFQDGQKQSSTKSC